MGMSRNVVIKAPAVAGYSGGKRRAALARHSRRFQDSQSNKMLGIVIFLTFFIPHFILLSHIKGSSNDGDSCESVTKHDQVKKKKCSEKLKVVCGRKWIDQLNSDLGYGIGFFSTAKTIDPKSSCSTSARCTHHGSYSVQYQGRCSNVCGDKTHWICDNRCNFVMEYRESSTTLYISAMIL